MHDDAPSALRTWLSTLPALAILLLTVAQGTSEIVQARMLAAGEQAWPGYADLRNDPEPPTCDPEKIGGQAAPSSAEDALLDDLVGGGAPEGAEAPAAPAEAPPAEAPPSGAPPAEAPPAGDDVDLDALVGGGGASTEAVEAAKKACVAEHERYQQLQARITPTLRAYRTVDHALTALTDFGRRAARPSLIFLIAICAVTASALRAHISLRPVETRTDARVAGLAAVVADLLATASFVERWRILETSGLEDAAPWQALVWAAGFLGMALVDLRTLVRPPADLQPGGSVGRALLAVPLYATMAIIASLWFLGAEQHPSGLAIYVDKLTEYSALYLQVGLYVWAGMLLKRTALPGRAFDVLRPWRMPPELLTAVVVLASAVPTAYSGASGIFVMAAGAVIYEELRRAGAHNQLALAATAMSGSFGVVLSPCLLVVIVASLNKQVTTTELFAMGNWVFALTATLLVLVLLLTRRNPLTVAPVGEAAPASARALASLWPYAAILVGTLAVFAWVFEVWVDEHSASTLVLLILLLFVLFEGRRRSTDGSSAPERLAGSTTETTLHIGALLALMAFSTGFGAIIERAELMSAVPAELGGPLPTMALLTVILVIIGMLMDPYGAVILVSATIAQVAYENGIAPLHFWMVVLVAFELGYLTPPVALNHLITRLVVGPRADHDHDLPADAGFYARHERYLLPVVVMGTALLIVAFGPLALS